MFEIFYNAMLPVFTVIALSALIGKFFPMDTRVLSNVAVYIFAPFLILQSLTESSFELKDIGNIALMVFLSTLVILILSWGLARLLKFDRKMENAFMLTTTLANTGNIGLPVVGFSFGTLAMERAVLFFGLSNIVLNSLGIYLPSRGSLSVKTSLKNVFKVPLIYAVVIGILINITQVKLSLPLSRMIDLLAQGSIPCMLVILGLQLSKVHVKIKPLPVLLATGMRLLVAPLIGVLLAKLLGIDGHTLQASVAEIGMPTAMMAGLYAAQYDCESEFVTTVILVSTVCSVLTLSLLFPILL